MFINAEGTFDGVDCNKMWFDGPCPYEGTTCAACMSHDQFELLTPTESRHVMEAWAHCRAWMRDNCNPHLHNPNAVKGGTYHPQPRWLASQLMEISVRLEGEAAACADGFGFALSIEGMSASIAALADILEEQCDDNY